MPLVTNEYRHLADRVAMLQDEASQWREYVMQLQQSGARLAASETQAQSNLKVAQTELNKQGLTLKSTEGQLNMVKDELHTLFARFQQREEQLTTQNARLMSERDSSRAENDKLKVELQQLKQHSVNQAEVIVARDRELALRNDERVKLLADNNQLQGRAQFAETELLKTTASLNMTKENLVLTDTELQKSQMALGDTSAREMSLQTKLNQVENECQTWMTHAKVHQEAEEARFRSAAYLESVRVPTPLVTTPLVTTPLSIYSTNYTSITRARLEEAKALERLQAARGNWIADGGRVSPKI
jgi:chromosome segregation ATPase